MDIETRQRVDALAKEVANLHTETANQQRRLVDGLSAVGSDVRRIVNKIAEKEALSRKALGTEVKVAAMTDVRISVPGAQKSVLDRTKESMKEGAKLAAANEAGEIALDAMIAVMPQLAELAKTPMGRAIGKALSAVALSYAAEASGFESAAMVTSICDHVVTVSSMEITADKLKLLRPAFLKLTELSRTLAAAGPTGPLTEG